MWFMNSDLNRWLLYWMYRFTFVLHEAERGLDGIYSLFTVDLTEPWWVFTSFWEILCIFLHSAQQWLSQHLLSNGYVWNTFLEFKIHTCKQWVVNGDAFLQSSPGMLQNGGSSGAAGALQQEMNSDIRAMDLGAPTASWEIMALRREMTHVTPMKNQLQGKSIYNSLKWHSGYMQLCEKVWGIIKSACFLKKLMPQTVFFHQIVQSAGNTMNLNQIWCDL